jgi:hypothetical protein
MNKRVILAGVLGAVAMFFWTFLAHMVLPLGEAGVKQIDNEQALLDTMKSTMTIPGIYLFPNMAPGMDQAQYQQKTATGPSGMLIYFPRRDFSFGKALVLEFGTELLQALLAAYLLSLTNIGTLAGRLGFYALVGLVAAVATNVSYWNWYGFPTTYTSAYMFTGWAGYLCAGLAASAVKLRGRAYAVATA